MRRMIYFAISLLCLLWATPGVLAEVSLSSVFSDHMVLQRDKPVHVWGKAKPGESITVTFNGQRHRETADHAGGWLATLVPMQASSEGLTLTVSGADTTIEIHDVVIGEVWVASGQSNMEWSVAKSAGAKEAVAASANDQIRMWTARRTVKAEPAFDVPGSWAVASPKTTGNFSAVAYYFACKIQKELGVPVGILHASWGGTPAEAWTSRDGLEAIDWAKPILQRYDAAVKAYPKAKAEYDHAMKRWRETRNGPANTGAKQGYAKPDFDDSQWKTMALPQTWEDAGLKKDGVVWFRKTVELPEDWAGQALRLSLGPIDDGDTTYVNGSKVGQTEPSRSWSWQTPREYKIAKELVKSNKLSVAVRVVDLAGDGGVWGQPEQLRLTRADGQGEPISLAGDWKYLLAHEITAKNRPASRPGAIFGPEHPHAPAGLFNGMIAPITPYTIQGMIWYQGESNASRAEQYEKLFPGLIADWRKQWGQGDYPFLFVQLANYRQPTDKIVDTDWAHLRDAQLKTLREVKNTGMAVTIDIGEANDIHPRNKHDVGERLARWALVDTYGKKDVIKSGPMQTGPAYPDEWGGINLVTVNFETFGSFLKVKGDGPLQGFAIAGEDGEFFKANAEPIKDGDGNMTLVKVWSDQVGAPVAVRYAWEDNPDEANLVNEEGLPASPFRTDDFKGPTDGRR